MHVCRADISVTGCYNVLLCAWVLLVICGIF